MPPMDPTPPFGSGPPVPPPPPIEPPTFLPPAPLRAFTTGEVLSETFSIFFSSPVPLLVTAVVLVPLSGLVLAVTNQFQGREELTCLVSGLTLLDSLVFTQIAVGAVTYSIFQRMRGRNTEVGESFRVGMANLGEVILVAFLQGLAVVAGFLLCIIPGILFAVMYSVAVPVAIEEKPGASTAMSRSSDLTQGSRWEVFFVLLAVYALSTGMSVVALFATEMNKYLGFGLTLIVRVLGAGLSATAATVMYYRLRSVKESLDVDQIASVFD